MRIAVPISIGVVAAVGAFFVVQWLAGAGSVERIPEQGSMEGADDIVAATRNKTVEQASIPLEEIRSGGPRKDGIPSLDNPSFVSTAAADGQLDDDRFGIAVTVDGTSRFYPYQILVWHEIVNDTVNSVPLAVTYCPLCFTGIAFERTVQTEQRGEHVLEFGVSGLLHDNNLLMYNRVRDAGDPPESLWSQVKGEAVVGPLTGSTLRIWPQAETVAWGAWKQAHPDGTVLSRETGYARNYDVDPYGDYYDRDNDRLLFGLSHEDDRLPRKEVVEGVVLNGEAAAYVRSALEAQVPVEDTVGGVPIAWRADDETGALQLFNRDTNERIGVTEGFWFSWVASNPETDVWPPQ